MSEPYRIVIAEDQRILREGLKSMLVAHSELEVVGEAEDGLEAVQCVMETGPDLVLLDISMPRLSGISAAEEIKRKVPDTRILLLTVHDSEEYIAKAFESGVDGYCLKEAEEEELIMAIKSVLSGKSYLSPGVSEKIVGGYIAGKADDGIRTHKDVLTPRELQVIKLIGEGHQNKAIAEFLCISSKTVEKHRANIMKKLDLHSASALTSYAIKEGLVIK